MKVCFTVDDETKIEFHEDEVEPEIVIRTNSDLIEIFGTKEDLKKFATDLYNQVHK